jgi:SNF family Na+-dependent transporter
MKSFLYSYQGRETTQFFDGLTTAYIFFIITFILNFWVLYRGISKGIEKLAKVAMPLLFLFAIIITIRVITLGTPDPTHPENSIANGFGFIWNPDFTKLDDPKVWLAAAGQIFFTLSLGMGTIHAYASYLKPKDDIALSGLATASTNEFAEVVLGGSIAIPLSVAFFGIATTTAMAKGGSFDLGFASMPLVFEKIPFGEIFGFLWFLLLFFAGITSSVAMGQQVMAFLEDEFGFSRKKSTIVFGSFVFISIHFVIFFLKYGYLDEMDYWAGTFGLVVFALIESIIFMWIFGAEKAWQEINAGAEIKIPKLFFYIMKYVTPTLLLIVMIWWLINDAIPILLMKNVTPANVPYIWGARVFMLGSLGVLFYLIHLSWKKKGENN